MDSELIAAQLPALRRYARVLTGDAWAADDLVQDTLERACSKWQLWRMGSDLRAWLFTVMHNLFLNQRRGARLQPAVPLEELEHELAQPPAPRDDALDLERCLLRLPAEQRAVLLLVSLEDMRYEEAARVLGVPVGTVMSRLSRARSRLRELMEGRAAAADAAPAGAAPALLRRLK